MYKVLLIEDEDIIRNGIRHSIPWEEYGTCVIGEASNGVEGAEKIASLRPHIVVTDINMPVKNGLQMIAETKDEYGYAAIILTGYSEFEYARRAIRSGVVSYVLKPLDMQEMKESLKKAVSQVETMQYLHDRNEMERQKQDITLLSPDIREGISDPIVTKVMLYLEQHYKEKVTLSDIEKEIHYSERYISQKFQQIMGTTIIEYLIRYRLQKALELIKEEKIPITQLGWECGIGEYKYFNHVFKKYIGCSAKDYQRTIRKNTG